MPQTGMALETVSNLWGRTLNPYNPAFGSGGSSGGEGVLVAMRGAPASPLSTDIGGSIRAPGAFNGLFAMRPTAERIPKLGMLTAIPGNVSIKVSAGPCVHSMEDLKLFVELILSHPTLPYEPTCSIPFWNYEPLPKSRKLRIGVMHTDGIVDPHPPIQRAIRESTAKLLTAGHQVVPFTPPFDLWEAAQTTWALYFQTGAKEMKAVLAQAGEPPIKQFQYNLDVFKIRELTVPELLNHNKDQTAYKAAFQQAWDVAALDCILCPCAPAAGVPHDFCLWWGYTTLWNLLDYPSIIMPVMDFQLSAERDSKDMGYRPRDNPYDRANWEICELYRTRFDTDDFANALLQMTQSSGRRSQ
jgi:amidase